MSGKRMISIVLGLLLMFFFVGCQPDNPNTDDPTGQLQDKEDWKWKHLGFENKSVDKIQVASNGMIFALSEGKLYFQEEDKWHSTHPAADISTFYLSENNEEATIVAGGDNGKVYLLSMENNSWNEVSIQTIPDPIDIISASPSTREIYVGQSSKNGGGLWKSSDGGITWQKLTDITVRGIAVHPKDPATIYIVDKLTYISADGGNNWHEVDTGANYGVLIHPLYPDTAYLAFAQGVVTTNHEGTIISQQRFYLPGGMTRLEFNPTSLNEWALGIWNYPSGAGGLYYTFNGGGRWLELGEETKDTRILDLCYDNDGERLYIGTADNGLWALNIESLKKE